MAELVKVGGAMLFALATLTGGGRPATADGAPARVVLVELFTSQGCSSCPPAEELVRELPRLGLGPARVLPLTFHVDYWDHLGWADPFADPAYTARQAAYSRSGHLRPAAGGAPEITGLYTPQMIVDGQVHLPGGQRERALAAIRAAAARPPGAELAARAKLVGAEIVVTARVSPRGAGPDRTSDLRLLVALVAREARTRVLRGENAGETLEQASVVRALSEPVRIAAGTGLSPALVVRLRKPVDLAWADAELVAFVQDERTAEIAVAVAVARD
jgi:hypothetical protein